VEISSCAAYEDPIFKVYGNRGGLRGDFSSLEWKYFVEDEAPARNLESQPLSGMDGTPVYCEEQLLWRTDKWKLPDGQVDWSHPACMAFYTMLYRTLTEGAPLEVTLEQVRQQLQVVEECRAQNPEFGRQLTHAS